LNTFFLTCDRRNIYRRQHIISSVACWGCISPSFVLIYIVLLVFVYLLFYVSETYPWISLLWQTQLIVTGWLLIP